MGQNPGPTVNARRAKWVVALALAIPSACGGAGGGQECGYGAPGLPTTPCEIDCRSWTNQVRPYLLGSDFLALAPDWSVSPPRADIKVGQRFRVTVGRVELSPAACNHGFESPQMSYRSSQPTVVAVVGSGLFEGVGPGTASVIVDNLRVPSGRTENLELTVCSQASAPEITCPSRVPLVIRVVP
jgi:hypothetical protein